MATKVLLAAFAVLFALAGTTYAAHPLITDDTGTKGKGKAQFGMFQPVFHKAFFKTSVHTSRLYMNRA
jgi:hypothetical protein